MIKILKNKNILFQRVSTNPILKPLIKNQWESCYVFNPAALYLDNKVHILYRAIGESGMSVFGYAMSKDGINIDQRSSIPAYVCHGDLKQKNLQQSFSHYAYASGCSWQGCEDPRLVAIGDRIYMTYTAFSHWGIPPGVALTSISINNFLKQHWEWDDPIQISSPQEMHKNWVIFPEKINNKFAVLHSISPEIGIEYIETLNFAKGSYIKSYYNSSVRSGYWDSWVRGVGPPPIKTKDGWLVIYHAMDHSDPNKYKIGAMILDEHNPSKILYRSNVPLLEPDALYENEGHKAGVIYACGAVVINEKLFIYYGGADTVVCAATADLNTLLNQIKGKF